MAKKTKLVAATKTDFIKVLKENVGFTLTNDQAKIGRAHV